MPINAIASMVDAEHRLREEIQASSDAREPAKVELRRLEESLDQCWDLLRQRRAKSEFGEDPEGATARPVHTVENYLQ